MCNPALVRSEPGRKSILTLTLAVATLLIVSDCSFAQEAEHLAVLKSGASLKEKSDACRQLARVATKTSIPALTALLDDEKLSHMARYALESIDDPAVV